jgi:hypothetical protein
MKVLHVIPAISYGGIERMLLSQYSGPLVALGSNIFTLNPIVKERISEVEGSKFRLLHKKESYR